MNVTEHLDDDTELMGIQWSVSLWKDHYNSFIFAHPVAVTFLYLAEPLHNSQFSAVFHLISHQDTASEKRNK